MRAIWLAIGLTITASAAAADSGAVRRALESQYALETRRFASNPPSSLEGFYAAAFTWGEPLQAVVFPVSSAAAGQNRVVLPGGGSMTVRIERMEVRNGTAVAVVSRRVGGAYLPAGPDSRTSVAAYGLFRHVWRNTGERWLLMHSKLLDGYLILDGKPFTAPQRVFNPNRAFRSPTDIVNNPIEPF